MKRILCIDDEVEMLQMLQLILEKFGYEVVTSTEAGRMAELLDREGAALLILDVMMPGHDGRSLFKELKTAGRNLPVLFLTGWQGAFELDTKAKLQDWQNLYTDGMTDVLYKPFTGAILRAKVEGLIGGPGDED